MKWETTVPLLKNSRCPLMILAKGHSQFNLPEEITDVLLDAWLQGDCYVMQFFLTRCFITVFLASELAYFQAC